MQTWPSGDPPAEGGHLLASHSTGSYTLQSVTTNPVENPAAEHRLKRTLRRLDRHQQRSPILGFAYGVVKKYGDDRGGQLAALLAYYGFLSLFPLLLVLVTVLGIVAGSSSSIAHRVEHSALAQFPVIGSDLASNIHALHKNSALGLVIGILGLLWGSQGASQIGQFAMAQLWNVPGIDRPGFVNRLKRTTVLMAVLAVFLVLGAGLAAVASSGSHSPIVRIGGEAGSLIANCVLYLLAFRVLTPKAVKFTELLLGATIGGFAWTMLQVGGTLLIDHQLRNSNQVYGTFAGVLGLIGWIYLGAMVTMYAAEANVVGARRLWPRSLVRPPLTEADQKVLTAIIEQDVRQPGQRVAVRFTHPAVEGGGPEPDPFD
jgi:YihY family inner membrane protein